MGGDGKIKLKMREERLKGGHLERWSDTVCSEAQTDKTELREEDSR